MRPPFFSSVRAKQQPTDTPTISSFPRATFYSHRHQLRPSLRGSLGREGGRLGLGTLAEAPLSSPLPLPAHQPPGRGTTRLAGKTGGGGGPFLLDRKTFLSFPRYCAREKEGGGRKGGGILALLRRNEGERNGVEGGRGLTEKPRPCSYENYWRSFASVSAAAGGGKFYYSAPDRKRTKNVLFPVACSFVRSSPMGEKGGQRKKRRKGPETQILAAAAVFPEEKNLGYS